VLLFVTIGCTRAWYRRDADRETYSALEERNSDPQWHVPYFSLNPNPASRLYDPSDPDFPPMPPDDPAAYQYMLRVNGMRNYRRWHKDGDGPIEYPGWRDYLPLDDKGVLVLTMERAVELAWLNSRDYQAALETVYEQALALTLQRFAFALHWFGSNITTFTGIGDGDTASHVLTTSSSLGFTKMLAAGGQLLVDFANSWVFSFNGRGSQSMTSTLTFNLIQPLLRGFGRRVTLEPLTQSERSTLYAVRDFARFRKLLYMGITTGSGNSFLSLLNQRQGIRNQEGNLANQERNYRLTLAQYGAEQATAVQVDQSYLGVQTALQALIQSRASFETALDSYKTTLGLPPDIPVRLDESLLDPFQLTDPALTKLNDSMDPFLLEYLKLDEAPPLVQLQDGYQKMKDNQNLAIKLLDEVRQELERWKKQAPPAEIAKEEAARIGDLQESIAKELSDLENDLNSLMKEIDKAQAALQEANRKKNWEDLLKLIPRQKTAIGGLYALQTRVRVFLIQLTPMQVKLNAAVAYARANRLDLMNEEARVVDAWRQIAVTANALKSDLTLNTSAILATPPGSLNPVGFSPTANTYTFSVQFNAPLNRMAERNAYRQSLINYQQLRRNYMLLDDTIQRNIRADLRQLEADRLNFDIQRRALVAAARAVESAEENLRLVPENLSAGAAVANTTAVLNSYNDLLMAKNNLIGIWVRYESDRVQLLLDMEALQLDEREVSANDADDQPADFLPTPRELAPTPGANATGLAKPCATGLAPHDVGHAIGASANAPGDLPGLDDHAGWRPAQVFP
jgi:outer membrane protein TolC